MIDFVAAILSLLFGGAACAPRVPAEGDVRLVAGSDTYEGNVEIFHANVWGGVCDDDWDHFDAAVVCKQLGFSQGVARYTTDSFFGESPETIWLDNVGCSGAELQLSDCKSDGFGVHDCSNAEAAGVECIANMHDDVEPKVSSFPRLREYFNYTGDIPLRFAGGRNENEGRVEIMIPGTSSFGTICPDKWTLREGMVVCRSLGFHFADQAVKTFLFGGLNLTVAVGRIACEGNEELIDDCRINNYTESIRGCDESGNVAGVICTDKLPDLVPDLDLIRDSTYLHDQALFYLQCAMEENCVASSAYEIQRQPDWYYNIRRLLRFSTRVYNIGDTAFRPFSPKETWEWHQCHMHHHSMEVFSHYDILSPVTGKRVAEGHKASFCLEDSNCYNGAKKQFACINYGDQGISVGCSDDYLHDIDCQWIDISDIPPGEYIFKISINPEYRVAEKNFSNNAVQCDLSYNVVQVFVNNCRYTAP